MGLDYYSTLELNRDATEVDLKKAYKRLAMVWHPDKNPVNKQESEAKFKQISEAYVVLSDPEKRQIYDLYGDGGGLLDVQSQAPPRRGYSFNTRDAEDLFAEFFTDNFFGERFNGRFWSVIETKLSCTLEELYKGARIAMRISRTVHDDSGDRKRVEETLNVDVKPGWKKGTKITFAGKGNQEPGILPADLIFVVDEKPHGIFKRDGDDLVINQKISPLEALTGKTLNITTLDERTLTISVTDIVHPGSEMIIENEGMPISKDPSKKGNLRIKFDIALTSGLTREQRSYLRRASSGAAN